MPRLGLCLGSHTRSVGAGNLHLKCEPCRNNRIDWSRRRRRPVAFAPLNKIIWCARLLVNRMRSDKAISLMDLIRMTIAARGIAERELQRFWANKMRLFYCHSICIAVAFARGYLTIPIHLTCHLFALRSDRRRRHLCGNKLAIPARQVWLIRCDAQ